MLSIKRQQWSGFEQLLVAHGLRYYYTRWVKYRTISKRLCDWRVNRARNLYQTLQGRTFRDDVIAQITFYYSRPVVLLQPHKESFVNKL